MLRILDDPRHCIVGKENACSSATLNDQQHIHTKPQESNQDHASVPQVHHEAAPQPKREQRCYCCKCDRLFKRESARIAGLQAPQVQNTKKAHNSSQKIFNTSKSFVNWSCCLRLVLFSLATAKEARKIQHPRKEPCNHRCCFSS